jgi:hypothetical protein
MQSEDTELHRGIADKQKARWPQSASAGLEPVLLNSASHPRRRAVRVVVMVMMASRQHETVTLSEETGPVNSATPEKLDLSDSTFR